MEEFGCGEIAAIGATSSFLVGMGVGAMPFAPLSECEHLIIPFLSARDPHYTHITAAVYQLVINQSAFNTSSHLCVIP